MLEVDFKHVLRERMQVLCGGIEAVLAADNRQTAPASSKEHGRSIREMGFGRPAPVTRALLEIELLRLHSALSRFEAGTYGDCLRCKRAVDIARLHIDPAATFCTPCLQLLSGLTAQKRLS